MKIHTGDGVARKVAAVVHIFRTPESGQAIA